MNTLCHFRQFKGQICNYDNKRNQKAHTPPDFATCRCVIIRAPGTDLTGPNTQRSSTTLSLSLDDSHHIYSSKFVVLLVPTILIPPRFSFSVLMGVIEVEPPSPLRYIIGAAVMVIGVVLPLGYMMFRNKRVPSSSSYSKQTPDETMESTEALRDLQK
ncbi:hypothetical protein TorRG33x02_066050 [Trema orientale]|uniref:Transmembrane protein n=1 Tax=Trema orientale TaxID=63057 RepID=A0A2P5FIR5_TREOI|nr:hypothetical protein TorRG33x02_066050 [Trema orientale]